MQRNWQIGSLFGIPLYIDSSWFLILAFVTIINAGEVNANNLSEGNLFLGWVTGLIMALLLFGSVLLHELGHSLVAKAQGIPVKSITLFLFGGIASIDRESKTPGEAFQVAIAGPAVSVALFGIFFGLHQLWTTGILAYLTLDLARINVALAIFNLIPGLPLDGGQVLKAIVWKATGSRFKGMRFASASGKLIGLLGIGVGLFFILLTGAFSAIWITFIAWFVFRNANAYDRLTKLQETLRSMVASEVMTREFRVVKANLSLFEFTQEYILGQNINHSLPYFASSDGRYRGMISLQDLQSRERSEWETLTLQDIAKPLSEIPSVEEKTNLVKIIERLEVENLTRITVLSPAGAVAGIIDRGDIVKAVAEKENLPILEGEIERVKAEGTYPPNFQLQAIAKMMQD